ncbi:hypothetical protein E1B28_002906 [Marasmius oreades]|uniref:Uncharacterized protein n=1 Tax=Marasmius oreades TaxID=181124 RepID=A0A9P7UK04_9AGAR|nr:uncharacterized protein E1B28_002906 [Marasmius oreades]KAG7085340.1 hypothetical protein E1B28_002906 [Marasmius oreades]
MAPGAPQDESDERKQLDLPVETPITPPRSTMSEASPMSHNRQVIPEATDPRSPPPANSSLPFPGYMRLYPRGYGTRKDVERVLLDRTELIVLRMNCPVYRQDLIMYLHLFQQSIHAKPEDLPLYDLEYLSDESNYFELLAFLRYVCRPEIRGMVSDLSNGEYLQNLPPPSPYQPSTRDYDEEVVGNMGNTDEQLSEEARHQKLLASINRQEYLRRMTHPRPKNPEPPSMAKAHLSPPHHLETSSKPTF